MTGFSRFATDTPNSSIMSEHLVLDPAIRNWCLFPLMIVMILVTVFKHYVTALLQSDKPAEPEELKLKSVSYAHKVSSNISRIVLTRTARIPLSCTSGTR